MVVFQYYSVLYDFAKLPNHHIWCVLPSAGRACHQELRIKQPALVKYRFKTPYWYRMEFYNMYFKNTKAHFIGIRFSPSFRIIARLGFLYFLSVSMFESIFEWKTFDYQDTEIHAYSNVSSIMMPVSATMIFLHSNSRTVILTNCIYSLI